MHKKVVDCSPPIKKQLTTFTNTPAQTKNSEQAYLGLLDKKRVGQLVRKNLINVPLLFTFIFNVY